MNIRPQTHRAAVFLGLMALSISAFGQDLAARAAFECPVTPPVEVIPSLGTMVGHYPVWMGDTARGRWHGRDELVKTIWIVARDHPGDLVITGRRLGGEEEVQFGRHRMAFQFELRFPEVHRIQMVPGGASRETIDTYAFRGSYVLYPSPGCWEMIARLGPTTVKIVHELKDARGF